MKLSFVIKVLGGARGAFGLQHPIPVPGSQGAPCSCILPEEVVRKLICWAENTEITLDPGEHQAYRWVTEDEIVGWGAQNIISMEQ